MKKSQEKIIQQKVGQKMEKAEKSQLEAFEDLDEESQKIFKKSDNFKSLDLLR